MVIRILTEHDVEEFVRLRLEALTREPYAFGRAPEDALPWPLESVAPRLRAVPEGNFLVDQDMCVIIDWEDVALAHPFFSLAPLSVGLHQSEIASPGILDRLERAYLAAFAEMAPPERLPAAPDARRLGG